jgi:hypothetical protein
VENPTGAQPVLVLEIALPGVYTADLEDATERAMDWATFETDEKRAELSALLDALHVSPACGVRLFAHGEKDSEMVQIRGEIRGARLTEPE